MTPFVFLLSASILIALVSFSYFKAWSVLHPKRIKGKKTPSDFDLPFQTICAETSDKINIKGWLIENHASRGLVVVSHNLGSNKTRFLPIAKVLFDAGFSIALFDLRGHGESGKHRGWKTPFHVYVEDLKAVIKEVRGVNFKILQDIILIGYSLGTVPTLSVAAENSDVRGLILDSGPSLSVGETFARRFKTVFNLPVFPFSWPITRLIGFMVGERSLRLNIMNSLSRLGKRPLLMIQGERDEIVEIGEAKAVFDFARTKNKELLVVPHAHHMTNFAVDKDAYSKKIIAFIDGALALGTE